MPMTLEAYRCAELAAVSGDGRDVEFRVQRRLRSPNEYLGRHWREKSRERKAWQGFLLSALVGSIGAAHAQRLLLPSSGFPGSCGGCQDRRCVTVIRFAPTRRGFIRDDDNLRFAVKPLLDALSNLGLIRDDHRKWLELPSPTQEVSTDGTFWTWIRIAPPTQESHVA
jgi:hypothetical protein